MSMLEQIAAELQGYDPGSLPVHTAQAFLDRLVTPVTESQPVGVFQALGRVLAQDVISPISVPPHDNSAMDGFALHGADLSHTGASVLRQVGSAYAGAAWQGRVGRGECLKIMTGAVLPAGLDTVVPIELVQVNGQEVTIPAGVARPGDNRRLRGEDLMAGCPALRCGERLGPAALGLIASLGLPTVDVWRRPKVAFFSTGDEILSLGQAPREGAVYDSNRYTLFGLLTRLGVEVLDMGVVKDEPAALEAALRRAAAQADAIITSGGVSMGEADYTKATMRRLGEVAFWRIAMRPGRPMAVGRITEGAHSAWLFGLPGNPVAVMVTFLAFVRPALLKMMGVRTTEPILLKAKSSAALRKKAGRTEYQRGVVTMDAAAGLQVRPTGDQGSGVLRSMVEANGLIVLHHHQGDVAAGDEVNVLMFEGALS